MRIFKLPVVIPDWARWTAVDSFGVLVAFKNEPHVSGKDWVATGRKKDLVQFDSQSFRGWKKTINRLPEL